MNPKPCEKCGEGERIERERFCKGCKKEILAAIASEYYDRVSARNLSRWNTEMIGRPAKDTHIISGAAEGMPDKRSGSVHIDGWEDIEQ